MAVKEDEKEGVKSVESEDLAEYLWRDFYEVKRKLTITIMTETLEL